ncbi:PAS domain-containing protein [Thermodesulfobacteriota bacterium]
MATSNGSVLQDRTRGAVSYEEEIKAAQIDQLYSQSLLARLGAAVSATALVVCLWQAVAHTFLLVWLACYLVVQAFRLVTTIRFSAVSPQGKATIKWGRWFSLLTIVSGVLWGVAGWSLFPSESLPHQFLLAIFLAGLGSAVVVVYSPIRECYLPTLAAMLLPLAARFAYEGNELSVTLGFVICLFAMVLAHTGNRLHSMLWESLRLRFEKNDLIGSLSTEVQERKRMEVALRESEEMYRLLVDHAHEGIMMLNIADGSVEYVNALVSEISGFSGDRILGRPFEEFVHCQDRPSLTECVACRGQVGPLPIHMNVDCCETAAMITRGWRF